MSSPPVALLDAVRHYSDGLAQAEELWSAHQEDSAAAGDILELKAVLHSNLSAALFEAGQYDETKIPDAGRDLSKFTTQHCEVIFWDESAEHAGAVLNAYKINASDKINASEVTPCPS